MDKKNYYYDSTYCSMLTELISAGHIKPEFFGTIHNQGYFYEFSAYFNSPDGKKKIFNLKIK